MKTKRYCFALDLVDDDTLINEYVGYHKNVWPKIIDSIKASGIEDMEIYITANRLFMIVDANDTFSPEGKVKRDGENRLVEQWEALMWKYQQALPNAKPGEKWILMDRIFKLD